MVVVLKILLALVGIIILILLAFYMKGDKVVLIMPENYRELLNDYVKFYQELDEDAKTRFEKRVEQFLLAVKITGVNAEVEDLDLLLIAAGAIIPVFAIP